MRLNKFIADSGFCSRREADRLIGEGRVTVDGQRARMGVELAEGAQVGVGRVAFHPGVGVGAQRPDLQALGARVVQGRLHQRARDAAAADLRRDAGVGDMHLPAFQLVVQVRLVPVDLGDEARGHRVMDDVDVLAHGVLSGCLAGPVRAGRGC